MNNFESINNKVLEACNYHLDIAKEFISQFQEFLQQLENKELVEAKNPICTTSELIKELKETNILEYKSLQKIAYRLEMLDSNYTFHLKEDILDKAEIIKLNNLDKKYNSDEVIKNELIEEIENIAADYGICIDDFEEGESL